MNAGKLLLINPTITSRRSARFPLAILSLATALEEHGYRAHLVDGNGRCDLYTGRASSRSDERCIQSRWHTDHHREWEHHSAVEVRGVRSG